MRFLVAVAGALALAVQASPVQANPVQGAGGGDPLLDARAAYARDDLDTAEAILAEACADNEDGGNREACWRLGLLLSGLPGGTERAAEQFAANCDAGDLKSCYYYAHWIEKAEPADEAMRAAALPMLGMACEGGLAYACTRLGRMLAASEPPGNTPQAVAAFDKGCRLGAAASCQEAGHRRSDDGGTPYFDLLTAYEQMTLACDLGIDAACGEAAILLMNESGVAVSDMAPERLMRIRANLRKSCFAGVDADCATMIADEFDYD